MLASKMKAVLLRT